MSFSTPNAYGINRLSAKIASHSDGRGVVRWLEIRFGDEYTRTSELMFVHFIPDSSDKFTKLAAAINEIFGETTTKEQISEV